jgi:hypothetical protein
MLPMHPGLGPMRGEPVLPFVPGATRPATPNATIPAAATPAAVAPTPAPATTGPRADAATTNADSKRIAAEIAAAQRAQTGLLLASLAGSAAPLPSAGTASNGDKQQADGKSAQTADPFRNHPFLPPPGASPAWVSKAMEQALAKYRQSQQLHPATQGTTDPLANGAAAGNLAASPPGP